MAAFAQRLEVAFLVRSAASLRNDVIDNGCGSAADNAQWVVIQKLRPLFLPGVAVPTGSSGRTIVGEARDRDLVGRTTA